MDPLSIAGTCVSLVGTITKTSVLVTGFVRDVRAARTDLDAVSRELLSLKTVLELLADDVADPTGKGFPETLKKQITGIVTNCSGVVAEIEQTLKKHEGTGLKKSAQWALSGKDDIAKLRSSLEAHKSALEIALDMVAMTMTIEIKVDTQEILNGNSAIKQDTALILAEIARLQEQLPRDRLHTSGFMLQRYLDNLTSYAETVVDTFSDENAAPSERGGSIRSHTRQRRNSSPVSSHSGRSEPDAAPTRDELAVELCATDDPLPQSVLPESPQLAKKPPANIPTREHTPQQSTVLQEQPQDTIIAERAKLVGVSLERLPTHHAVPQPAPAQQHARQQPTFTTRPPKMLRREHALQQPAVPHIPPQNQPVPESVELVNETPERLPTQDRVPRPSHQQPVSNTLHMPSSYSKSWRMKEAGNDLGESWERSNVEPEEVQELLRGCTLELKAKALDIPFFLLPFRPISDERSARTFIEKFFSRGLNGQALAQELRVMDPIVLCAVTKWCWSRLQGGVVGWEAYELFSVGESDSNMARDSFATFIPLSTDTDARTRIIFDFFDLLSAAAAHHKMNGLGGRKLSRLAGWWAFEHADADEGFERGYKNWLTAADATSHLFFAYLRSLTPNSVTGINGISTLPLSLQKLVTETEYPLAPPELLFSKVHHVVMLVDMVAPTPIALLRRANISWYRGVDKTLEELSRYEDLVQALTDECRRVLKLISSDFLLPVDASQSSQAIGITSRPKSYGTSMTPSWADFLSSGYSEHSSSTDVSHARKHASQDLVTANRHRKLGSADQSWDAFRDIGFASDSSDTNPPVESNLTLEPSELAKVTTFKIDDTFWWVWMASLAAEEPQERKGAFGRSVLIQTTIHRDQWFVFEELVKGVAPMRRTSNGKNRKSNKLKAQSSRTVGSLPGSRWGLHFPSPVVKEKRGFWGRWRKSKVSSGLTPNGMLEEDGSIF